MLFCIASILIWLWSKLIKQQSHVGFIEFLQTAAKTRIWLLRRSLHVWHIVPHLGFLKQFLVEYDGEHRVSKTRVQTSWGSFCFDIQAPAHRVSNIWVLPSWGSPCFWHPVSGTPSVLGMPTCSIAKPHHKPSSYISSFSHACPPRLVVQNLVFIKAI